jgi:hypothetical protein
MICRKYPISKLKNDRELLNSFRAKVNARADERIVEKSMEWRKVKHAAELTPTELINSGQEHIARKIKMMAELEANSQKLSLYSLRVFRRRLICDVAECFSAITGVAEKQAEQYARQYITFGLAERLIRDRLAATDSNVGDAVSVSIENNLIGNIADSMRRHIWPQERFPADW